MTHDILNEYIPQLQKTIDDKNMPEYTADGTQQLKYMQETANVGYLPAERLFLQILSSKRVLLEKIDLRRTLLLEENVENKTKRSYLSGFGLPSQRI